MGGVYTAHVPRPYAPESNLSSISSEYERTPQSRKPFYSKVSSYVLFHLPAIVLHIVPCFKYLSEARVHFLHYFSHLIRYHIWFWYFFFTCIEIFLLISRRSTSSLISDSITIIIGCFGNILSSHFSVQLYLTCN